MTAVMGSTGLRRYVGMDHFRSLHCGEGVMTFPGDGCGKMLEEVAGHGDVVIKRKCRFCKSTNVFDLRLTK